MYNPIQVGDNLMELPKCPIEQSILLQYYFEHGKAPPFKHNLIDCDQRAVKEFPLDQLPYAWAEHVKLVSFHELSTKELWN